jgi:hypothetical protein
MRIKDTDRVVVLARDYDEESRLTGARIADEDRRQITPNAACFIEACLARLGWARLDKRLSTDYHEISHTSYSVFVYPDFLGLVAPTLNRKAEGTLCAREYTC